MRCSALVFYILFSICSAWPVSEVPELAENWGRRSLFPEIYNFPESLLPAGVSVLYIGGIVEDYDSLTIFLIGLRGEEPDILASGPYSGEHNFTKSFAYWIDETATIEISFQMPSSARYAGCEYSWQDDELIPACYISGDPSLEAVMRVDSLLALGLIEEADTEMDMIFYPQAYFYPEDMAARFLRSAHQHALELFSSGDPEGAAQLMDQAERPVSFQLFCSTWYSHYADADYFLESPMATWMSLEEFVTITNDYGFFLEQAGRYDDAIQVLQNVLTLAPERTVAYLNTGDAYQGKPRLAEAARYYQLYVDMMVLDGLEEQIPYRVTEFLLSYFGPL